MMDQLQELEKTHRDLTARLTDPEIHADQEAFRETSKKLAEISPVVDLYQKYKAAKAEHQETEEMLGSLTKDDELFEMAHEEKIRLDQELAELEGKLRFELTPKDPNDARNVVLEIRAGTGGDEATLFAAELFRMYSRYAEQQRWRVEIIDLSESGIKGVKEVSAIIEGKGAYSRLKHEAGVHRVQRVPETEASGRIHTSAVTVAVLPEAEDVEVSVAEKELRIDRFCSSGPGGQGVNTTYSAVRITHLPTGIVVSCQNERSQHQNKDRAMQILAARLLDLERQKRDEELAGIAGEAKAVGFGSQIRSYVMQPYQMVKDLRSNHETGDVESVLDGNLDPFMEAFLRWRRSGD